MFEFVFPIYYWAPTREAAEATLQLKITVYDDHFIVKFKSGIEIQIDE